MSTGLKEDKFISDIIHTSKNRNDYKNNLLLDSSICSIN